MKNSSEKRGLARLLSIPVESVSAPVFGVGAFLLAVGGLQVIQFFLGATAVGALAMWIGVRRGL
jgi:branched-subunit amino acid ABC-type transport system permease component